MRKNLRAATLAITILWAVFLLDLLLPPDLRMYGLQPRNPRRLWGILTYPFLHADLRHLAANSGALFTLLLVALAYNRRLAVTALINIYLLTGILVWMFGRGDAIHIGASGIVFGLIGFLMCIGWFRRDGTALGVSLVIGLCYGGALVSLLAPVPGTSWSSHLFGFFSGAQAAAWARRGRIS